MAGLFILGGSSYYTLQLLESLNSFGLLERFSRIALFGRNERRLALIAEAGAALTGNRTPIEATTEIETCLDPGFDILFNQIRFGGLQSRDIDEKTAIEVGLPADETLGIVGVSNSIRGVVGMKDYLEVIRRKSSPYVFLNFTNPCSIICQLLTRELSDPVLGVCDYPAFMRREISIALGAPPSAIDVSYFGLNHFGFIYDIRMHGRDVFAQAMQTQLSFKPECNRYFDQLLNISWSFVFEAERIAVRQRAQGNRASALLSFEREMDDLSESGVREPEPYLSILAKRNCDWYNLAVSPTIARLLNRSDEAVYLNCSAADVFDLGIEDSVVECNCDFEHGRAQPVSLPGAPRSSPEFLLVRTMKKAEILLLDGILSEDRKAIMESCLLNPMIRDFDKASSYFSKVSEADPLIGDFWR